MPSSPILVTVYHTLCIFERDNENSSSNLSCFVNHVFYCEIVPTVRRLFSKAQNFLLSSTVSCPCVGQPSPHTYILHQPSIAPPCLRVTQWRPTITTRLVISTWAGGWGLWVYTIFSLYRVTRHSGKPITTILSTNTIEHPWLNL